AALAAEPARADLSLNLYVLGWALAVPCIVVVARLAAVERPALASFGGLLTLAGVTVSIFWGGISTFEHGLALFADRAVATAALEAGDPPAVVYLLLPGIPLGWPLLALAAWRGGVLPVWRAAALALVGTIPFWVLGGFPMLLPLPFVAMAVAFVPLGLALLRDGGAEKEGSAREAE
ncbi:MAG TPA: hypothetical protein VI997_08945, partial [Candidatus Thermoplasmatota archaeon]|nr:hypothetical protein [Candidatus Thermoplasmatota archaeon]